VSSETAGRRHFMSLPLVDGWSAVTVALALVLTLPIIAVISLALAPAGDIWSHLASTVLPHYISTSLWLMTGTALGTLVIGAGTAWLVTMYEFPGRRLFEWALVLPLAMPAYVIAYVYTDLLEFAGPVQGMLRDMFGWQTRLDYWFPNIRTLGGAIAMMSLVLYPYVYLLARAAFLEQSVCALEVSRTLGKSAFQTFRHVALPLARPAVIAGLSLVMMETLNDFGTVDYFAVATFTAGIYDVWLNMNSIAGAAQLAVVMLIFILGLILTERLARRGRRFHNTTTRYQDLQRGVLSPGYAVIAMIVCLLPIILGFALPAGRLAYFSVNYFDEALATDFFRYVFNSVSLAGVTALIAVAIGLVMTYSVRLGGSKAMRTANRIASIGYAVPGAVLAIGVIVTLGWLNEIYGSATGGRLLLTGTLVAVVFGYLCRFSALSIGSLESSLGKITPSMDDAARSLGCRPTGMLRRVHMPIMRPTILTAGLLVFVDVMKELPMTILLRPFNFETLATYVHQYASDELLEQSSLGALTIVACGVLPVILLSRSIAGSRRGRTLPVEAEA